MNTLLRSPRRKQRGQMGIIGTILGLVVIGLVLYYVMTHFGAAKSTQSGQAVSGDFTVMSAKVQSVFRNDPSGYANATEAALIGNGAVPQSWVSGGTAIVSPYGHVAVAPTNIYGTDDGLDFTFSTVPSTQCSDFVNAIQGSVVGVTVGGTTIKSATQPFSAGDLGTACKADGTTDSVAVVATLGR